jgi:class 3 adenylate cyclase
MSARINIGFYRAPAVAVKSDRLLAAADEDRTLARLRALRSDLIDPTIAVHKGRVVKRTGDGLLVEFRSTQSAVTG